MHHSHEEDERAYQRRRKLVSIFSLVVMLALFALISLTIGRRLLHFASDPAGLRAWAENQGDLGPPGPGRHSDPAGGRGCAPR